MSEDIGKLVLRLSLGGLMLFHGLHTLLNGLAPLQAILAAHNIPENAAYFAYLGGLVAPILIIVGLFSRVGAVLVMLNVVIMLVLADFSKIASIASDGSYALEVQAFYFFTALAVSLLGAGRFSAGPDHFN